MSPLAEIQEKISALATENLQLREVVRASVERAIKEILEGDEEVRVGECSGEPGLLYLGVTWPSRTSFSYGYYPSPLMIFPTQRKAFFPNETAIFQHQRLAFKLITLLEKMGYEVIRKSGEPKQIMDKAYGGE